MNQESTWLSWNCMRFMYFVSDETKKNLTFENSIEF